MKFLLAIILFLPSISFGSSAISGSAEVPTATTVTSMTVTGIPAGSVVFSTTSQVLSGNPSRFSFDGATGRVGIGTTSPGTTLDVAGQQTLSGTTAPKLAVLAGSAVAGSTYSTRGLMFTNTTSTNCVGTSAMAIYSATVPANAFGGVGSGLEVESAGTFAGNGNNKVICLAIGGQCIAGNNTVADNNQNWVLSGRLIKSGSNTQNSYGTAFYGTTGVKVTVGNPNVTETSGILVQVLATCATADADISGKSFVVEYLDK